MKNTVLALAVLALLQTALAHSHSPRNHTAKREDHVDHNGISEVIVYVDQFGNTLSVETRVVPCTTTQPVDVQLEPTPLPAQQEHPVEPTSLSYIDQPRPAETDAVQVPTAGSAKASFFYPPPSPTPEAAPANAVHRNKYGISYSPYRADSTCKSQEEVDSDFVKMTEYPLVRIYGVDCDQVRTVTKAAKRHNMTVFAGIFDLHNLDESLKTMIDSAQGDWSTFDTISIGNELVNKGQNVPSDVVNAVHSARDTLRAAGWQGPVVTVDTFNKLIQHPELCQASDYCAANCHAFFDSTITAAQAGPYVKEQAERVSAAAGGKRTVITESGWPYAGQPNGAAVPSRENQRIAIESLKKGFPDGGIILFTAFDDKWKTDNRWTFSTEKFWGFLR
ncbi:hypothetical protein VTN77DRAFT_8821 [Rasamsonia byssochlamydoides]|uniref:uncharacterized protein n=1 Tax=Rasamsonia byssochlamydoides TaxID=89139 RepID=UPI0037426156